MIRFSVLFKILFTLLCINTARGQDRSISGIIIDIESNDLVPFAHVFFSNTTYGKTSSVSGKFYMDKLPAEEFILVVSIVGYETYSGTVNLTGNDIRDLQIKLKPKTVELEGVSITGKTDKKWNRLYNVFEREFIGETLNSKNCEIENPWVIEFTGKSKTNNLSIIESEPVIVINRSLGYKITYYLEQFIYDNGTLRFYGFPKFELLTPLDEAEELQWTENRKKAYIGSTRHFFYTLVNNLFLQEDFKVFELDAGQAYNSLEVSYSRELSEVDFQVIVRRIPIKEEETYLLRFNRNIEVRHQMMKFHEEDVTGNTPYFSRLKPLNPNMRCSKTGWVNVLDFEVVGYWANQRVADLLPYEYIKAPSTTPIK